MFRVLAICLFCASASAFQAPVSGLVQRSSRSGLVAMTSQNSVDPYVLAMKKKGKTGSTVTLKGYTVGSRAPSAAVKSGTNNKFGFGIDNLYGAQAGRKTKKENLPTAAINDKVNGAGLGPLLSGLALLILIGSSVKG